VWTVNANDVEWIQCEHVNKPGYIVQLEAQIQELEKVHDKHQNKNKLEQLKERLSKERNSQKFNLEPENFSPEVTLKHFCTSFKKEQIRCKMNQIPANSNDGTYWSQTTRDVKRCNYCVVMVNWRPVKNFQKL
jgi:hypothetical protein